MTKAIVVNKISTLNQDLHGPSRERYVGSRVLRCKMWEFDSGKSSPGVNLFSKQSGRGKNRVSANINMKCTSSGCPIQYEGTINKKKAYYRSRHDSWYLEVYDGEIMDSKVIYRESGDHYSNIGYAGMLEAEEIIMLCAMNYAHYMKGKQGMIVPFFELK